MASGRVCRANRPNTWLHRPSLPREDSPCQPGAVHTWPKADIRPNLSPCPLSDVPPGNSPRLSRLDTRALDHLAPLLGFVGDQPAEGSGRERKCRAAQVGKSCLDFGIEEGGVDLLVKSIDDLSRCVRGHADARPPACLVTRHEFADGRDVR